jgi:hypothetical protein
MTGGELAATGLTRAPPPPSTLSGTYNRRRAQLAPAPSGKRRTALPARAQALHTLAWRSVVVDRKKLDELEREIKAAEQLCDDVRLHPFGPGAFTRQHEGQHTPKSTGAAGPAR